MSLRAVTLAIVCALGPMLAALPAAAEEPAGGRPLWEAGVAGGVGLVPDYPGSDRRRLRGIVLPYLVYRGPVLRVDETGVHGRVFESPDWSFELTGTAAFDARSDGPREGMPALDYLFGVGPQLVWRGLQRGGHGPSVHLKLRALMSTDGRHIDRRGFSVDPELRWRLPSFAGTPATLTLSLQPTWASRGLQAYFYEVDPSLATATRPAYRARAGYLGTDLSATLTHSPAPGLSWFVSAYLASMHGAANTASPLLRERSNLTLGTGLIWTPWRSERRVAD